MKQKRADQYRCFPTPSQRHVLARTFGCARFVYNWGRRLRSDAYRQRGEHLFSSAPSAALTLLKQPSDMKWRNEVSRVPPQQALRPLEQAFTNVFDGRAKDPTFKKQPGRQAAEDPTCAFTWDGQDLHLAKMDAPLPILWSRPWPEGARPSTVPIPKDQAGRSFVWFLVEEELQPLPVRSEMVGIDLGLLDGVTRSTGEKTGNERCFRKEEKRLARRHRRHEKSRKGSKNREKARRKVARLHARIADRRHAFHHQLPTRLIGENHVVCVESLAVKHLLPNDHLAKAIADVGWGELIRQLQYKAMWYGRTVGAIARFYPSSKRCSVCGHSLESLE
jgi:putative transposase